MAAARKILKKMLQNSRPARAFLSGDGTVVAPLREDLAAEGMPETSIRVETFFNHISRKAPA